MRRLLLVCASLSLLFLPLAAQTDNQQKFKVTGSVVNSVSGEPVRGAMVDFQGSEPRSTMTGADGRFELDNVNGGYHSVTARRPGFAPLTQWQSVIVGSSTQSIVVKLLPFSKISGRVVDRESEPIDGVQIQCMFEQIVNGHKQWQVSRGATTDETGHFLIEDLTPGTYILGTRTNQLYRMPRLQSEASRYVYPATFYPSGTSREMAQRIELAPGEETKLDMELQSIRAVHVSVATAPRYPNVTANLFAADDNQPNASAPSDSSGTFTFRAVPPGSWKIVVRSWSGRGENDGEMLYGELPVEVGTTDVENLTVPVNKLPDIPVIGGALPNGQLYVQLFSKNGQGAGSTVDPNGDIRIRSVAPGTYRVVARAGAACVTSISSGSQDLMRDQLVVSPGGSVAPIQVAVSNTCAQLTTNIAGTQQTAMILVTSSLPGFEPRQTQANKGSAMIDSLSSGEYQVYAFDNLNNLEFANPDVMRDFKSQTVALEAGQKASVQLELNERRTR